jgi:hypothetical protein
MSENVELKLISDSLRLALQVWQEERDTLNQLLDTMREIRDALIKNNLPTGFDIKEEALRGETMAKVGASVDLQILDDGKGVLFTISGFVNKAGNPVSQPAGTITGVSSAPASLTSPVPDPGDPTTTPPRLPDTTGLVFLSTVAQPVVDATDVVVTFTDTETSGGTITEAAGGIDIVADDSAVGFSITETSL